MSRVLIYGMNYAPEFAGVGKYTGEIAEYLASTGAAVTVVTTPAHYPGWQVQDTFHNGRYTSEVRNGVVVLRCPLLLRRAMGGIWRLLAPLSFALTSAPVVVWQILRYRPDMALCIVPTLFGAPAMLLAARMVGARTVLHVQDLEVDAAFAVGHLSSWTWLRRFGFAMEAAIITRFSQIITISERMAEKIAQKGADGRRIDVVRNWVDIDLIRPLQTVSPYRRELGYSANDFIVQYSGNIGRKQGLGILLQAARRVAADPRIKFVIAGEGPLKAELMAEYEDLANVRFYGFQPHERLSEFLGMADLHALPQDPEATDLVLPSKLGGMLASSRPILVMAEPGTELVQFLKDSVTFIPPGALEALVEAVRRAAGLEADAEQAHRRRRLARSLSKREGLLSFTRAATGQAALQR